MTDDEKSLNDEVVRVCRRLGMWMPMMDARSGLCWLETRYGRGAPSQGEGLPPGWSWCSRSFPISAMRLDPRGGAPISYICCDIVDDKPTIVHSDSFSYAAMRAVRARRDRLLEAQMLLDEIIETQGG